MDSGFYSVTENGIALHCFTNSSDQAVQAWFECLCAHIEATPPTESFRVLMDVSSPQVDFTRFARQKSQEVFTRYKQRRGRLAFLFSSRTAPHFARIFFATLGKVEFQRGFFSQREEALHWLGGEHR